MKTNCRRLPPPPTTPEDTTPGANAPAPACDVRPLPLEPGRPHPQMGSFGVLLVVLDPVLSQRTARALRALAPCWRGRDVVFLSALKPPVGRRLGALMPEVFYNSGEPLMLDAIWRLLPWRLVMTIKAGKTCCLYPAGSPAPQPQPKEPK